MKKLYTALDCETFRSEFKSIGFVPTMGNLHEGHISLLRRALEENDSAVISIFVNPTQFGVNEDFDKYPRTLDEDLQKIEKLNQDFPQKTIGVFLPETKTMYPDGMETPVKIPSLSQILEGKLRPTHFDGVTTIVQRLFSFVKADVAYFGQKDYQQLMIIKEMVKMLNISIKVIGMPIVRDHDGLALSSRNRYLSSSEREKALILPRTLIELEEIIKHKNLFEIKNYIENKINNDSHWNYLEVRKADSLLEMDDLSHDLVVLGNYQLGNTKLLDNRIVKNI